MPPPPADALKEVEGLLRRLRAEASGADEGARRARLFYEIGEIEERAGDEPAAARDYLAAYNADALFREPLEALLRLLERRRSLRNLGKIVDALTRMADTPDETVRARVLRALFLDDAGNDVDGAKRAAIEATEVEGASAVERAMAWLSLEIISAKVGDAAMRARALAERTALASNPTWRALLLLDSARLAAAAGEVDEAFERLARARTEGAGASFAAAVAEERLTRIGRDDDAPDGDGAIDVEVDAVTREIGARASADVERAGRYAAALEAQAALVEEAIESPARGDALGVPRWARKPTYMVDAWLRAAEARALHTNELGPAATLLERAREALAKFEPAEVDFEQDGVASQSGRASALNAAVLDARMRIAQRQGDTALAAQLAEARIASEEDGGVAAALAMRIAEHASSEGDAARALAALSTAVARDPACIPARALQLDLLADGDPAAFATEVEALSEQLPTEDGKARALLLAAYLWGARVNDADASRSALTQAGLAGADPEAVARLARMMASLARDDAWYEEATRRLLAAIRGDQCGADHDGAAGGDGRGAERALLSFELARSRFARGDDAGARTALRDLGATTEGAWLGRALEAFLPAHDDGATTRAREALDELATRPQPADVARGLVLMAAVRAHRAGDIEGARTRLRQLAAQRPDDVLVATYLTDLERSSGAYEAAAHVAEACADALEGDAELAGALRIEAALGKWRSGDRPGAIATLDRAIDDVPDAAREVLGWAVRGVDVDSLDARRRAIARALDAGGDEPTLSLERFATELAAGSGSEAAGALATAERAPDPGVALAAALARAAWPASDVAGEALDAALARIAGAGTDAATLAAAEGHRRALANAVPEATLDAARTWFQAGGGLGAGVEWLAAAMSGAGAMTEDEAAARRAIAASVPADLRDPMLASAALLQVVVDPAERGPLLVGDSDSIRLVNLELAPPGCDPRRRIAGLTGLGRALGEDAEIDATSLAGWSWLVDGNPAQALVAFEKAAKAHPDDLGAWEGLRTAAQKMGDTSKRASASEAMGALTKDDARSALFWEEAGRAWLELGDEKRAENALDAAFTRDAHRAFAFDKVFRRVRERKDGERLLEVVARRLAVSDDPPEIAKLFWEQARVLREKGDQDGALKALENVTMLEPDHVGALALTGEIALKRGKFDEAAEALARLALLEEAPAKNRITAGVAAVDLYENKLDRFDRALEILLVLHRARLSTLPVRERLARAAARTGSWKDATAILEELMHERPEVDGRIEAARLAMAIHRDRLNDPRGARAAVVKLLEESPIDGEALDMLLGLDVDHAVRAPLLEAARVELVETLQRRPMELPLLRRLAKVARALGDDALQQIALSCAIVVAGHDATLEQQYAALAAKKGRVPQIALTEGVLKQVVDPGDRGPVARLFAALGPTIAEALGPSLQACGVTKKDRIDPRSGIALRNEIAAWAGSFGIAEFDLYVGGKDPLGVQGVPGEPPALVVGAGVNAPLAPATRARVARELLAMVRGSTIVRHRDDTTIAALVVAACNLASVKVDAPSYAVLADVEKLLSKAIARKTRKLLPELCQAVVASSADARAWSKRALASHNRVAALASGDVAIALVDALGEPIDRLPAAVKGDARAEELFRFALSPAYLELRRALGLEGGSG